jgi:hypothetical protein
VGPELAEIGDFSRAPNYVGGGKIKAKKGTKNISRFVGVKMWKEARCFWYTLRQCGIRGLEARFSCTCKARRKDAGTARLKNKRRCPFSVILALKEDWVKSHPRLRLVDAHSKNLPSVPESAS